MNATPNQPVRLLGERRRAENAAEPVSETLMTSVQLDDDERAFTRLVERWRQAVWRLCTRMTGDAHRGDDLAQETFARVYEARATYRPTARFSTYLWRIALNMCHDERRRVERRGEESLDESERECAHDGTFALPASAERRLLEMERAGMVREALSHLPETHRTVVVLRHYEHLKFREIAEVMGIPEGTLKSRMAQALDRLSRDLGPLISDDESTQTPRRRGRGR